MTTPIAVTNSNTLNGLTAGTYTVIAIQSVGALSNTQQQSTTISNLIVPVTFQIASQRPAFCGQSGTITVNTDQGTPMTYEIISGPMLFPPQASNIFTGLAPGDYDIRVNDVCGDGVVQTHHLQPPAPNLATTLNFEPCGVATCNTREVMVNVTPFENTSVTYPLQVQLTLYPPGSAPIILNQTIPSGPSFEVVVPFFNIPDFIPTGYYGVIRIVDPCGNILTSSNIPLDLFPEVEISQTDDMCQGGININGLCNMAPPYTINFLSAPPEFNPANYNIGNLGPFDQSPILYLSNDEHQLPEGNYVIEVTDACGRVVQGAIEIADLVTDHQLLALYYGCNIRYYVQIPSSGISPATVILVSAPAGYIPPIPQDLTSTITNGVFSMELLVLGVYEFTGINVCGDTYTVIVQTLPPAPVIQILGSTIAGCMNSSGSVTMQLVNGPAMDSVIMVSAPAVYNHTMPYDVSAFIGTSDLICTITELPIGDYSFVVTDICGRVYPVVTAAVLPGPILDLSAVEFLRGCQDPLGSMKLKSVNDRFVVVTILSAPAGFGHPLPYDVSFNIDAAGVFYMNSLPYGTYVFYTKDICGIEHEQTVVMLGHEILLSNINIIGNCGSFNLVLYHLAAQPYLQSFWLQKWNPVSGRWGHPLTGIPYPNATQPFALNSYQVYNFTTNFNIASLGTFRVLKYLRIFSNGNAAYTECFEVIKEFDFTGELTIDSTGAVPCSNGNYDVFISGSGIPPFTYSITTMDGQPFVVNNGSSNTFTGLAPAVYNFLVEDTCGNRVNRELDITTLAEPSIFPANLCEGQNGQLSVQAISFLTYRWWKGSDTSTILSTTNVLSFSPYSNATTPGTYYVRIYSTSNLSCIDKTISYVVLPSVNPNAGIDAIQTMCGNINPIDLFTLLGPYYDTGGVWAESTNSGVLTGSVWSPATISYGTYNFNYTLISLCGISDTASVTIHFNPAPSDPVITADENFCGNGVIALQVDTIAGATYSWTGPNGFASNLQNPSLTNSTELNSGLYTLTANLNGCASTTSITLNFQPSPDYIVQQGCVNGLLTLSIKPKESVVNVYSSYSWTGPAGFNSTDNPVQLIGSGPGLYQVTATNSEGCSARQSVMVASTLCSIPNVITPDGDNTNDSFDLSALDVSKLEIYSRWGRLVYEQNNYVDQWHGQNMQNRELPDSTYYYIIYLKSGEEKQGWIYKMAWR